MKTSRATIGALAILVSLTALPSPAKNSILLMGDSMMKAIAPSLEKKFSEAGWDVKSTTAIGTGLARLDLYDWLTQSSNAVTAGKPDVVIVMMGANDNQAMRCPDGIVRHGSQAWEQEYSRRINCLLDGVLAAGVKRVVWIEMPAMRESALDADVKGINALVRQAVTQHGQTFFETRLMLSKTPDGAYSAYVIQANGMPLHVRSEDGIHLNRKGADWLADRLLPAVQSSVK